MAPVLEIWERGKREVSASNEHCRLENCLPLHVSDNITIFMVYDTPHGRAGHIVGSHPMFRGFQVEKVRRARKTHKVNSSIRGNLRCRLAWTQRA